MIEVSRSYRCDFAYVFIAAVTRCGEHYNATSFNFEAIYKVAHRTNGGRVVCIIENDLERMLIIDIHATRNLEECRVESSQSVTNIFEADVHVVGQCRGKHCVLHIVHGTTFNGCRYQVRPHERCMSLVVIDGDHVTIHALFQHKCLATGADVLFHQHMSRIHGHVTYGFRVSVVSHLQAMHVIRVQYRGIGRNFNRHTFDFCKLFQRVDALQSQVIR